MNCVLLSVFVGWYFSCKNMQRELHKIGITTFENVHHRSISWAGWIQSSRATLLYIIPPSTPRSGKWVFFPAGFTSTITDAFVLCTLPIFGTPQPYRYHFKLQWTSSQAVRILHSAFAKPIPFRIHARRTRFFDQLGSLRKSHCIRGQGNVFPYSNLMLWH